MNIDQQRDAAWQRCCETQAFRNWMLWQDEDKQEGLRRAFESGWHEAAEAARAELRATPEAALFREKLKQDRAADQNNIRYLENKLKDVRAVVCPDEEDC